MRDQTLKVQTELWLRGHKKRKMTGVGTTRQQNRKGDFTTNSYTATWVQSLHQVDPCPLRQVRCMCLTKSKEDRCPVSRAAQLRHPHAPKRPQSDLFSSAPLAAHPTSLRWCKRHVLGLKKRGHLRGSYWLISWTCLAACSWPASR